MLKRGQSHECHQILIITSDTPKMFYRQSLDTPLLSAQCLPTPLKHLRIHYSERCCAQSNYWSPHPAHHELGTPDFETVFKFNLEVSCQVQGRSEE